MMVTKWKFVYVFTTREIARAAAAILDGATCAQLYSTNVSSIAYFARVWMVASTWPAFEFLRRKWRGKGLPRSNLNTAIMSCSIVRICACEYALSVMYTKSPFLNLDRKCLLEKKHVKYGTFSMFWKIFWLTYFWSIHFFVFCSNEHWCHSDKLELFAGDFISSFLHVSIKSMIL